ncbi:3938_t:CDS:2 [Funneliformis mosseae]|uniref:3938_t:CDS:1 n=1 Tax=Funneliformis mosseae TaxID=27381 RepID=A0A9N9GTJ8_FUNMO|nr:3938_t:CDS:2 [Funneliformis mosseae]
MTTTSNQNGYFNAITGNDGNTFQPENQSLHQKRNATNNDTLDRISRIPKESSQFLKKVSFSSHPFILAVMHDPSISQLQVLDHI